MAEQTESSIVVDGAPARVMAVIADLASYPEWSHGVKSVEVLARGADGLPASAHFVVDAGAIKDSYTLAYDWHGDRSVTWRLAEAGMLKALDGAYELTDNGDGTTKVVYRLSVDVSIPMIGLIKRKAEKVIIDTALRGLKERVEA